ncbi:MAG: hypothetical protein HOE48_22480 [Candidatus Latescibacteria bacterium]|jgi:hypothetical protein|nr:hypothetical protein [Candidatus Latescibacterota bacterium]MBT4140696.1 hypothetical protein [Candidatus Latescibacterota bacterium]
MKVQIPGNFADVLTIDNAAERLDEAKEVAVAILSAGVELAPQMDHAAIFTDPPHLVAGPLKEVGYIAGWDKRCYPSPVDGQDYINVPSGLPEGHSALSNGWFRYVAVVHPVDQAARDEMLSQDYGNPFIHHLTWGIVPPKGDQNNAFEYTRTAIKFMVESREKIGRALNNAPGTLIMALPEAVVQDPRSEAMFSDCLSHLPSSNFQIETMQGDGILIQFFVLTGGRIEVALRVDTQQTFNPKSVHKISEDEISTRQTDA